MANGQGENGFPNFEELRDSALNAARQEPDELKKQLLAKGAAIAAAAIPIPVAGWIIAGVAGLLTLFGVTIKGRTQHVPRYPDANASAIAWSNTQWEMFNGFPDNELKEFYIEQLYKFNVRMFAVFGNWWNAVALRENPNGAGTLLAFKALDRQFAVVGVTGYWYEVIMASADAESVNENMKTWYFDNYQAFVLKPVSDFMLAKYNESLDEYLRNGGKITTGKLISGNTSLLLVGGLALAWFAGLFTTSKK